MRWSLKTAGEREKSQKWYLPLHWTFLHHDLWVYKMYLQGKQSRSVCDVDIYDDAGSRHRQS